TVDLDMDHAIFPVGPAGRPAELQLMPMAMVFKYSKYPNAAKDYLRFCMEEGNYDQWINTTLGYYDATLRAYENVPVWNGDPKVKPFQYCLRRGQVHSYATVPGPRPAAAHAEYVVVDMFANATVGGKNVRGVVFVAPAVLILLALLTYPFFLGIYLSLTDAIIGRGGHFVGLANYTGLLGDPLFRLVTFNTFLYTTVACTCKLILGLALAIVLNREFMGKRFIRAIVLLPYIVPTVLSAISFWWIYDPTFGIISYTLRHLGLIGHNIDFLGDPGLARGALIAANVWRGVPFYAIGLLAGLQTVPGSLYEAAAIDGAGGWSAFRHITMPLLRPLTVVITMFSVIQTV